MKNNSGRYGAMSVSQLKARRNELLTKIDELSQRDRDAELQERLDKYNRFVVAIEAELAYREFENK